MEFPHFVVKSSYLAYFTENKFLQNIHKLRIGCMSFSIPAKQFPILFIANLVRFILFLLIPFSMLCEAKQVIYHLFNSLSVSLGSAFSKPVGHEISTVRRSTAALPADPL